MIARVVFLFSLAVLLTADGQYAVVGRDLDLIGIDSRELEVESQLVLVFADVDRRRPAAGVVAAEGVFEEPVNLPTEAEDGCVEAGSIEHFPSPVLWVWFGGRGVMPTHGKKLHGAFQQSSARAANGLGLSGK